MEQLYEVALVIWMGVMQSCGRCKQVSLQVYVSILMHHACLLSRRENRASVMTNQLHPAIRTLKILAKPYLGGRSHNF